jgi:hypothetical protein
MSESQRDGIVDLLSGFRSPRNLLCAVHRRLAGDEVDLACAARKAAVLRPLGRGVNYRVLHAKLNFLRRSEARQNAAHQGKN